MLAKRCMMSSRISRRRRPRQPAHLARVAQYLSFHRGRRLVGGSSASRHLSRPVLSAAGNDCRGVRAALRQWRSAASRFRHAHPPCRWFRAGRGCWHRGGRADGALAAGGRYHAAAREHRRSHSWSRLCAAVSVVVRARQYSRRRAGCFRLFRHVVLPGALPYIVTGLRLGLAQAWRILVAVEMLAAVPWGLGWLIFGAQEFLNTDVMLAGITVIALIGLALEKFVFQPLENFTVVRWGMMT